MKPTTFVFQLALIAGCKGQEYDLLRDLPAYGQSNPPAVDNVVQQDRIVQVTTPLVDVLWVVDNSSSMGPYQQDLAQNFPAFMNYFLGSGLDYHIGVVSTDMARDNQSGKLTEASTGERYISLDTVDPMAVFQEMAELGEIIGSVERGREAAFTALELLQDEENVGFLRDDRESGVHVMIISDEPDYSNNSPVTKDEFVGYLNGKRADPATVTFNSICRPSTGDDYIYVSLGVGGILHDIQQGDWIDVLDQLGVQAAGLKREFFLSRLPVVDTIEVRVTDPQGVVIPFAATEYDYSPERNSITFDTYLPDPLAQVTIEYTVLSALAN
ncbi:MAG: hypothetical protein ABMA64_15410 [Myxococcota bacterium]